MLVLASSPVHRVEIRTTDKDEMCDAISRMYSDHRPRFDGPDHRVDLRLTSVSAGPLAVDRIRLPMTFKAISEPIDYLFSGQALQGRLSVVAGGNQAAVRPGDVWLYPIGVPIDVMVTDGGYAVVRLPMSPVAEAAEALTGIDASDLRIESMHPVSAAMGRYWAAVLGMVHREAMAAESALADPIVAQAILQTLAGALLTTFPNTVMTATQLPGPGYVAPAALRRAVAYIEAHAEKAVSVTDVAAAAGVGARALQYAFRRHYDTTPLQYLRRVRLERAHRDLQAGDPVDGDTVVKIATRWGFVSASRFAASYRAAYGTTPVHTLRT